MKKKWDIRVIPQKIHITNLLTEGRKKFAAALPVIIFFLVLFYTIIFFFGVQYALVVSFITAAFKVNLQKKPSLRAMLNLLIVQLLICALAFFATVNLFLCIVLNILVPFVLIYLQTTQFNQKGYFVNAMAFVFLQLRPVGWDGFLPLMGIIFYAACILIGALCIYSIFHKKSPNYAQERKGLFMVAQNFMRMADGIHDFGAEKDILVLQTTLHRMAYGSRNFSYVVRGEGKIHYMFALFFQRASYYIADFAKADIQDRKQDEETLRTVSYLLREAANKMNTSSNADLIEVASGLSLQSETLSERSAVFIRNFLRLFVLIMESMTESATTEWKLPKHAHPVLGLKNRLRMDSFEVRFALRLSIVSTISFMVCRLTNSDHAYWLPLNAFILLQPMYEESAYRMKTRLIGTAIGCLMAYFALPLLPDITGNFIFATVMISLMYCCTPGTWVQPIFATGFALSLASLTMDSTTAIELRIFYLILSVMLVLIANRFLFPNNRAGQFRCNMRELYHIQNSYLNMLSISTRRRIDYGVVCDALITFHLIYDEVRNYLKKPDNDTDRKTYGSIIAVMWRMVAEIEQLILCTRKEALSPQTREIIDHFAWAMKRHLQIIRRLPPFDAYVHAPGEPLPNTDQSYIDYLMQQYASNLYVLEKLSEALPKKHLQ